MKDTRGNEVVFGSRREAQQCAYKCSAAMYARVVPVAGDVDAKCKEPYREA